MRLGTWAVALLAAAITLGVAVPDVEAGSKSKKRRVYIDHKIKSHQLQQLERHLKAKRHQAVRNEVRNEIRARRATDLLGGSIANQPSFGTQLLGLGVLGVGLGRKSSGNRSRGRKRGRGH